MYQECQGAQGVTASSAHQHDMTERLIPIAPVNVIGDHVRDSSIDVPTAPCGFVADASGPAVSSSFRPSSSNAFQDSLHGLPRSHEAHKPPIRYRARSCGLP